MGQAEPPSVSETDSTAVCAVRRIVSHGSRHKEMHVVEAVRQALAGHPAVRDVRLAGSRASSEAHELSDWDFAVETDDFAALERDLPALVAPLRPLVEQWDRYSETACYMLMLRGPTKVDLIFPSERREWSPAWEVTPETLVGVDRHFWDWALWLEQKRRHGRSAQLEKSLGDLFELLLRPLGVSTPPRSIEDAVASYLEARAEREREFDVRVPRELEAEVRPVVAPGGS